MPKKGQTMSEEEKQRRSRAMLRHWHGDNWTEEDQKQFERERNTRMAKNYRNSHREHYTEYSRNYQQEFRRRNPYYYAWKQWNRKHPYNQFTLDEYIQMRITKEENNVKRRRK